MESIQPAPGEDVSCALALVNTRHMRGGEETDEIPDAAAAGDWLASRGLLDRPARLSAEAAARLRQLRESIRALFEAKAADDTPAAEHTALLNAALAAAPPVPLLTWGAAGPRKTERLQPGCDGIDAVLARIATDALGMLTAADAPAPAPCRAHGCIRWFIRTHAARQWCSTRCGDRVRAARHYARHRKP